MMDLKCMVHIKPSRNIPSPFITKYYQAGELAFDPVAKIPNYKH